jgi:hypothetical protein
MATSLLSDLDEMFIINCQWDAFRAELSWWYLAFSLSDIKWKISVDISVWFLLSVVFAGVFPTRSAIFVYNHNWTCVTYYHNKFKV